MHLFSLAASHFLATSYLPATSHSSTITTPHSMLHLGDKIQIVNPSIFPQWSSSRIPPSFGIISEDLGRVGVYTLCKLRPSLSFEDSGDLPQVEVLFHAYHFQDQENVSSTPCPPLIQKVQHFFELPRVTILEAAHPLSAYPTIIAPTVVYFRHLPSLSFSLPAWVCWRDIDSKDNEAIELQDYPANQSFTSTTLLAPHITIAPPSNISLQTTNSSILHQDNGDNGGQV